MRAWEAGTAVEMGVAMTVASSVPRRSRIAEAAKRNLRHIRLPVAGEVVVPPPERVVYYAGLGVLAAVGLVEWPLAVAVAAGHVLADQKMFRRLRGLGEAAESA
jgi:hypothetical protein